MCDRGLGRRAKEEMKRNIIAENDLSGLETQDLHLLLPNGSFLLISFNYCSLVVGLESVIIFPPNTNWFVFIVF